MKTRILGRTGIKVSEIAIGGEGFENKDQKETKELIDYAFSQGINFIDVYNSNPKMRSQVGEALAHYPRESFVVEGHLCSMWEDGQYRRTRNLEEVKTAYQDFLTRMKLDYCDIGMIHYCDDLKDFDQILNQGIMEYAQDLKQHDVIRSIGLSTRNPDVALKAVETGLIDVMLFSINPAYDMLPSSEDVDILFEEKTFDRLYEGIDENRATLYRLCEQKGVALTVMKCFGAGVLLDEKQSPFKKALTPIQCLHYCLTRPAVAAVMCGIESKEEIAQAVAYETASPQEKDYAHILADAPRTAFHGQCMYCGHCAPCTMKIDIASVNKYLDLSLMKESAPETLHNHYDLLEHHGSECIACGVCMTNCPFGVDIIAKMQRATEVFGH